MAEFNKFEKLGQDIGALLSEKNKAYGSAFAKSGRVLAEMYPNGVAPEQFQDMLATVRILDKLFRIATDKTAFAEEPWKDIAGYAILSLEAGSQKTAQKMTARKGIDHLSAATLAKMYATVAREEAKDRKVK